MMRQYKLLFAVACLMLAAGLLIPPLAAGAQAAPHIDAAVQVTPDPSVVRGHATPAVAVNPLQEEVLTIAEGDAYTSKCSVHVSTDAGLSWAKANVPEVGEPWTGCMFATTGPIADVEFGRDGTLYYAFSGFDPRTYRQRIFLARSTSLGQTWETTELPWIERDIEKGQAGGDALPSVAVDFSDPNRVYVAWWSNNGAWTLADEIVRGKRWCNDLVPRPWVAASTDGGRTFSEPVDMAGGVEGCMTEPYLVTGNNGELFAFFGEATRGADDGGTGAPSHLYVSVSRDGARTFTVTPIYTQAQPEERDGDWLSAPAPGIDRKSGALYLVWEDMGEGVPSIRFMRSTDGAKTWSTPVALNDAAPKRDWDFTEMFPSLSVSPTGRVDVAWYDWRNDLTFKQDAEENSLQDVYYTYSTDGGGTWADNLRVNDRILDRRFGARKTGFITGPVGMASTGDVAFVAWDDTRNGNEQTGAQDIYATRVRFATPDRVFGASARPPVFWLLIGTGGALLLGGLLLLVGTRAARR